MPNHYHLVLRPLVDGGGVLFGIGDTHLHRCFRRGRSPDFLDGCSESTLHYRNPSWQRFDFQLNGADRLAIRTGLNPLPVGSTWSRPSVPVAANRFASSNPPSKRPDPFDFPEDARQGPRSVTLGQLPSLRPIDCLVTFGTLFFRQFPFSYRGLTPHKFTPMLGVPMHASRRSAANLNHKFLRRLRDRGL